ncbi:site-specific integrase [Priestia megaterium]|uniref:tyrosine-type recombinase/integrase n=1 Tax=Priestia megaterium TaxID=1404 RepID=UPI002E1FE05C|nr:site-specific integrase [Priestia megaterium]
MSKVIVENINKNKVDGNGKPKKANWRYRFQIASVNGKRRYESKTGFTTRKAAELAGNKAYAEYINAGEVFKPSELSVHDYMDLWFEKYCIPNTSYNSQVVHQQAIKKYVKPYLGKYQLSSLKPAVLQEFLNDMNQKGYAKTNIEMVKTMMSSALKYAVYPLEYIQSNPMQYVKMPRITKEPKEKAILTEEQFEQVLQLFPEHNRHHIPILLGVHCGLRTGEICGLTWDDIDFEKKTLTVNKQTIRMKLDERGVCFAISKPKTRRSVRMMTISNILLEALKREKAYQERCEEKLKEDYLVHTLIDTTDNTGKPITIIRSVTKELIGDAPRYNLVCVDAGGNHTSNDTVKYVATVVKEQLNLPNFSFHSLRHTHATMLVENNVNTKNLQHRMGHDNILTTLNTYVKNTRKMDQDSANVFDELFNK